ncbi:MAG: sensor histidine kinase, partial [Alphaproteobacteria bacterium]
MYRAQRRLIAALHLWWRRLSLAGRFGFAGAVVLIAGMLIIGVWVAREIERGVTRNTAATTALYIGSVVAPLLQELAERDTISAETEDKLDRLIHGTELNRRIISFKVWKQGGRVIYATRKSIVGRTFPETPNLRRAWSGEVTAEFDSLGDEEDRLERNTGLPLLEIYSPVHETRT